MHFLKDILLVLVTICLGCTIAAPAVPVHPGSRTDIIITANNTVNATSSGKLTSLSPAGQLPLSLINNLSNGSVNAYVTGLDASNQLVMLQPDGNFFYPTANSSDSIPQAIVGNIAIPLGAYGETLNITIPGYISAARIWFAADGDLQFFTVWSSASNAPSLVEPSAVNPSDPSAAVNWGFVELTNTEDGGLYANVSYVDFVGLPLGISMTVSQGTVESAEGVGADAVSKICASLVAQATSDGYPWNDLCQNSDGEPLRVIAPGDYVASNPTAFEDYWTDYVSLVWSEYASNALTFDTQASAGNVSCTVQNGNLTCAGDNRGYSKPTAGDIFGCNSGPFAILDGDNDVHVAVVPRLCAAFNRGTLLLDGGNYQPSLPSSRYYTTAPCNYYSAFVHENEIDGQGYAFSYDDVNPDDAINQSGVLASAEATALSIIVGGPNSSWR